jgi:protein-S-isoprenylcysteine O-methyltransferase Ste14
MTEAARDNPGVIIFPPLLLLIVIIGGVCLDWVAPLGFLSALPVVPRIIAGAIAFALGAALASTARATFVRAGTNVRPDQPALNVVSNGIFAHMRNPMYVGGSIAALGLALMFASDWMVLLLVPARLVLHYGVVKREERYLEKKFGEAYLRYKATVPRYGWKQ